MLQEIQRDATRQRRVASQGVERVVTGAEAVHEQLPCTLGNRLLGDDVQEALSLLDTHQRFGPAQTHACTQSTV